MTKIKNTNTFLQAVPETIRDNFEKTIKNKGYKFSDIKKNFSNGMSNSILYEKYPNETQLFEKLKNKVFGKKRKRAKNKIQNSNKKFENQNHYNTIIVIQIICNYIAKELSNEILYENVKSKTFKNNF